ncbi:MAG: Ger(x)C family spore germination protein [Clostridiales bacterium]|nr:Ger(x)C family spore germination protein [Clostridiales bacterium]
MRDQKREPVRRLRCESLRGRISRACMLLICLSALSGLTGCYSRHEINSLAIVMGVGVDEGSAQENYLVTAQVAKASAMHASAAEGSGSGTSGDAYVNGQYEADSIFSAMRGITYIASRDLYFSHNQIIAVGRKVAERNIVPALDLFLRDYEGRLTTMILVADGKAVDLLNEKTDLEKLPALHLHDMLEVQKITSTSVVVSLHEFLVATLSKTTAPVAPIVELFTHESGKEKARVGNTAVFKGGRLIGELNKAQTRGLLWVTGKVEGGALETQALGGRMEFELLQSSSRIEPAYKDGRFSVKVKVTQECMIAEAAVTENIMKLENAEKLDLAVEEAILEEARSALDQARALNADVFGFGEAIRRKYPAKSEQLLKNWENSFAQLEVELSVTAVVRSTGGATIPIAPGGMS